VGVILDDIEALTRAVGLQGEKKLVQFSPVHVQMMELRDFDRNYFAALGENYLDMLGGYSQIGYAFTGVDAGRPYLSFGAIVLWPGVAEIWMTPDRHLSSVRMSFHRAARHFLSIIAYERRLVRLQAMVHTQNVHADRWIKSMHFCAEGTLKTFGPEGADYTVYARTNGGHLLQSENPTSPTRARS